MQRQKKQRVPILIGGDLALDFVNSLYWRLTPTPIEWFNSYQELLSWCCSLKILNESKSRQLLSKARIETQKAAITVVRAIKLREAIYGIFDALIHHQRPDKSNLDFLNQVLNRSQSRRVITRAADGFCWQWADEPFSLDCMLGPIAQAAAELLASGEWKRVGQCAGDGCGWLFLDLSKNHSRRWCAMEHCGHKTNAKLHYHRKRNQLYKQIHS